MQVDGGDNYHNFGDKHIFYLLFDRPTSVHVAGGSTFSTTVVGLIFVMSPGYPTLHSSDKYYWNPIDRTNILYLSAFKLYRGFHGASHESLSSCTFREFQGHTFLVNKIRKKT